MVCQLPVHAPPPSSRATIVVAAPRCTRCTADAGANYALSTISGELLCAGCSHDEELSKATAAAGRSIDEDWVGERRCGRCQGVASAGELVHLETSQTVTISAIPVLRERIQEGSVTIFDCGRCGHSFELLNGLLRMRIMLEGLKAFVLGVIISLVAYGLLHCMTLGPWFALPLMALPIALFAHAAKPYFDDVKLRRQHPPLVRR